MNKRKLSVWGWRSLGLGLIFLLAGCSGLSTPLPIPTASPAPSPTSTQTIAPTAIPPTPTVAGIDRATFLWETYSDYSSIAPDAKFVKTWEVKNSGTSTWTQSYSLALSAMP